MEFKQNSKKGMQTVGDKRKHGMSGSSSKKTKYTGKCFNYKKVEHKSLECRLPKNASIVEANDVMGVETIIKDVAKFEFCAVVNETNVMESNPIEWWLDSTRVSRHICDIKESFTELTMKEKGQKLVYGQ